MYSDLHYNHVRIWGWPQLPLASVQWLWWWCSLGYWLISVSSSTSWKQLVIFAQWGVALVEQRLPQGLIPIYTLELRAKCFWDLLAVSLRLSLSFSYFLPGYRTELWHELWEEIFVWFLSIVSKGSESCLERFVKATLLIKVESVRNDGWHDPELLCRSEHVQAQSTHEAQPASV